MSVKKGEKQVKRRGPCRNSKGPKFKKQVELRLTIHNAVTFSLSLSSFDLIEISNENIIQLHIKGDSRF